MAMPIAAKVAGPVKAREAVAAEAAMAKRLRTAHLIGAVSEQTTRTP